MIWKPVHGFEGYYSVSDCGQVRSEHRTITRKNGWPFTVSRKIIACHPDSSGYLQFRAYNTGSKKMILVSRAVYEAHKEPLKSEQDIDHIDNNPLNNHISNLQALKRSEHGPLTLQRMKEKAFNEGFEEGFKAAISIINKE